MNFQNLNPIEDFREKHDSLLSELIYLSGKVSNACQQIERAWSTSSLGYHARMYFGDFEPPPPGMSFNVEWGGVGDDFVTPGLGRAGAHVRHPVVVPHHPPSLHRPRVEDRPEPLRPPGPWKCVVIEIGTNFSK